MKNKIAIVALLILIIMPSQALAMQIFEMSGTAITKAPYYSASDDYYYLNFDEDVVHKIVYGSYDSTYTKVYSQVVRERRAGETLIGIHRFTCNSYYQSIYYDASGNQVGKIRFQATELKNPTCNSTADGENGTGSGGSCSGGGCGTFECPAWGDYMGKVDQIIEKIPSPPNWQTVSEIFRDTIAPQIKKDMGDLLGKAPELPDIPGQPTIDAPKMETPQGKEDPALGDSSFDANDIKNNAPVIKENEDPTGGFNIMNPIDELPTDEEYMKHIPKDGDLIAPNVPETSAPIPVNPKDPENLAPTPNENIGAAPTPDEGSNKPPIPDEGANKPPIPSESGTPPLPGDGGGTAPLPNEGGTAPLPGKDGGTAPLPGR